MNDARVKTKGSRKGGENDRITRANILSKGCPSTTIYSNDRLAFEAFHIIHRK